MALSAAVHRKRYLRRVLLMHGLLLLVVVAVVLVSLRLQYQSLRDQGQADQQSRQQQTARQIASLAEARFDRLGDAIDLVADDIPTADKIWARLETDGYRGGVYDRQSRRVTASYAAPPAVTASPAGSDSSATKFSSSAPTNDSAAVVDAAATAARERLPATAPRRTRPTSAPAPALGPAAEAFLQQVQKPEADGPFDLDGERVILLATPTPDGARAVFVIISQPQMAGQILRVRGRGGDASVRMIDDNRRYVAFDDAARLGTRAGDPPDDPRLGGVLQRALTTGAAQTEVFSDVGAFVSGTPTDPQADAPRADATDDDRASTLAFITAQPLRITPGQQWTLVLTSVANPVDDQLHPIVRQLVTWTLLVIAAVMIVLISTAVSLIRGRRRVEAIRMAVLSRDLEKARQIQLNWLPAPRDHEARYDIAAENRPARHISGDFYNWFDLPAEADDCEEASDALLRAAAEPRTAKTAVVLGDVTGHGLPAAFLMATTQMLVRSTLPRVGDPGRCLTEINRQLCTLVYGGQFVTMMILIIDHDAGLLHAASAGQTNPLLRGASGWREIPVESQLVAGVDESIEYTTSRFPIPADASILLFTDGITEATSEKGEQFGDERLIAALDDTPADAPAETVLRTVVSTLEAFAINQEFDDDLTLVALRLLPEPKRLNLGRAGKTVSL